MDDVKETAVSLNDDVWSMILDILYADNQDEIDGEYNRVLSAGGRAWLRGLKGFRGEELPHIHWKPKGAKRTLMSLRLASRSLYRLCTPYLFHLIDISISPPNAARIESLTSSNLGALVREVRFFYPITSCEWAQGEVVVYNSTVFDDLAASIHSLPGLSTLHLPHACGFAHTETGLWGLSTLGEAWRVKMQAFNWRIITSLGTLPVQKASLCYGQSYGRHDRYTGVDIHKDLSLSIRETYLSNLNQVELCNFRSERDQVKTLDSIMADLRYATSLRQLRIYSGFLVDNQSVLQYMGMHLPFDQLCSAGIQLESLIVKTMKPTNLHALIDPRDFIEYLQKCGDKLKEICLHNVILRRGCSWAHVFMQLAKCPVLERVDLEELRNEEFPGHGLDTGGHTEGMAPFECCSSEAPCRIALPCSPYPYSNGEYEAAHELYTNTVARARKTKMDAARIRL